MKKCFRERVDFRNHRRKIVRIQSYLSEPAARINMAMKKNHQTTPDFPKGLAAPAIRAITGAGYTRLDQLTKVTEAELLELHGMEPKAIGIIRDALKAKGKSFAKPKRR
jgi:hypothetical protein